MSKFAELDAQILAVSVDHVPCLKAWSESLGGINYPLLSDFWPHGKVAEIYGVFREEGKSERAIFVIDKIGIIQYIDIHDIDDQPSNEEVLSVLRRIDPRAAARQPKKSEDVVTELPKGGIVLYCTNWCPDCRRARAWLEARNLDFTEVNVDTVPGAAEQVKKWADGNRVTPTFDIDGTIVVDFDVKKLEKVLKGRL